MEFVGQNEPVLPFLKWAGGKRWLVSSYPALLKHPFERYIEPFLGSGAVFFHLAPHRSILADRNEELIETYQAIKDDWRRVFDELKEHHRNHSKSYYYAIRRSKRRTIYTRAARFIYLNRTCWNGLYRVNFAGRFNVPVGTKTNVILDSDNFGAIATLLRDAELRVCDFEQIVNLAKETDLLFVDPPYTVKHNLNGFIKYNEVLFSWDDQVRLRDSLVRAKARGAKILITNAHHRSIRDLYKNVGECIVVKRSSVIAAQSKHRRECEELIVKVN